jgi:acyl-CoA synthetase (AMP-forming)/AMP-acid ligase II
MMDTLYGRFRERFLAYLSRPFLETGDGGLCTYAQLEHASGRFALIGLPVPGVDLRITDEEGRPRQRGEAGVLEVRTAQMFAGYWRRPEETQGAEARAAGAVQGRVPRAAVSGAGELGDPSVFRVRGEAGLPASRVPLPTRRLVGYRLGAWGRVSLHGRTEPASPLSVHLGVRTIAKKGGLKNA